MALQNRPNASAPSISNVPTVSMANLPAGYSADFADAGEQAASGQYLRIAQRLSSPVINNWLTDTNESWLGKFYLTGNMEDGEEFNNPLYAITIVPIAAAAKRQRWSEQQGGEGRMPICQATGPNFKVLEGTGEPGGPCVQCAHSKWSTDERGRRSTGCDQIVSYMVFVNEWNTFVLWDLTRTARAIGTFIQKTLQERGRALGGGLKEGYGRVAFSTWPSETVGGKGQSPYDKTGVNELLLLDAAKPVKAQPGDRRRPQMGNVWYVPEIIALDGSLEDNGIVIAIDDTVDADFENDNDLPF